MHMIGSFSVRGHSWLDRDIHILLFLPFISSQVADERYAIANAYDG